MFLRVAVVVVVVVVANMVTRIEPLIVFDYYLIKQLVYPLLFFCIKEMII